MRILHRRRFLQSTVILGTGIIIHGHEGVSAAEASVSQWYRGNLHLHTQWSDGSPMPEWAVAWYKKRGYHFICTSDHNTFQTKELQFAAWRGGCVPPKNVAPFQTNGSRWKEVVEPASWQLTQATIDQAAEMFGSQSLTSLVEEDRTFYRLKTFDELVSQFVESEKFLLIPGFEQTGTSQNGRQIHMNFINVRSFFPYIRETDVQSTVNENFFRGKDLYANHAEPSMGILNHPIWPYYDIEPQILIDNPEIRFFEFNNNGLDGERHPQAWTPEKFWDIVNTHRVTAGQPLLLGTGSDDEHSYRREYPKAWMVVRSESLDFPSLYAAMDRGDFYASNGLDFDSIVFDRGQGTLSVKIKAEPGVSYRIDFIGTKKDADRTCTFIEIPAQAKRSARTVSSWSDQIGVVLQSVVGTEADYTLDARDLYVRARVTILTEAPEYQDKCQSILRPAAWTQPYSIMVR
ncbi:MAG: hypothetical protein PHE53_10545 [Thermoguttaceae bacterium]|nr:hypothetical protein [Thermoguttaceae bacterium]